MLVMDIIISSKRNSFTLFLILATVCLSGQVINPWTNSQISMSSSCNITKSGIFEGYIADYGVYAHKGLSDKYKALPFLFMPSEKVNAPVLLILNGGPGASNLVLPAGIDFLLEYFNILLPGYRGVDDYCSYNYEKYGNVQELKICDIDLIAEDISNIVNFLKCDSVYIAAHSFGVVYASKYMQKKDNVKKTSIFFSPITTQNIIAVISNMEKMVRKYFEGFCNGADKYEKIITDIKNSSSPEQLSMALTIFLSDIQGGVKIDSVLEWGKPAIELLQNIYTSYENSINKQDRSDKLSCYFNYSDTTGKSDLGRLGILLYNYFINNVLTETPNFKTIEYGSPSVAISAFYDYSIPKTQIVIENTGHSDIWNKAWQFIITYYTIGTIR